MKLVYTHEVRNFETDKFQLLPPSMLARLCIYGTMLKSEDEGLPSSLMMDRLNAVWMVARLKIEQKAAITDRQSLDIYSSDRCRDGVAFLREVVLKRRREIVASSVIAFISVDISDRKIIRPAAVEALYRDMPGTAELGSFKKLSSKGEYVAIGSQLVRGGDCDFNGHLTTAGYVDAVCEHSGYWGDKPMLMEFVQVDFHAECAQGTQLEIQRCGEDIRSRLRGVDHQGTVCFNSAYEISDL